MNTTFTLANLPGLAATILAAAAAMPFAAQSQSSVVQTPITNPAAFLADRNSQPGTPVTAGTPDSSFGLDKAPPNARGNLRPIGGDPAYGHTYTDAAGLYTFVLARGWSWEPASADRRAVRFWGNTGTNMVTCGVTPMDYWRGAASLAELQVIPENVARATFEQGVMESLGWKSVDSRGVLMIGDGRTPVRALSWGAASADGKSYDTVAIIEAPANAVMIMCTSASTRPKLPEAIIKLAFRLAEEALVPANVTASPAQSAKPALAFNANLQSTVKKMLADGKSRIEGTQPAPSSPAVNQAADQRHKLQSEFDNALARKDRDTIYRIGPVLKDVKFCQYVYNDPAATKQQLYDGASSCPPGPMFDTLTQRFIKSLPPVAANPNNSTSTPNVTYSAPAPSIESPANHARRVMSQRDFEIREMNKRIDNAGRR